MIWCKKWNLFFSHFCTIWSSSFACLQKKIWG
jgi:hypothetical protein